MCSELRESAKQFDKQRGVELQYTQNLLKEAQANIALLEGKEAMAKEDAVLHARMADETQDKYKREVVDHGRTVEGFCRSNGELSALKVKLETAEQQANEQVFKLEESRKNWEDLNEIGEQRIEQLTIQLTNTQSQKTLLLSQLEQEAVRAQSETVAQHSELLEKVHALNLLQESSRVLRDDKNTFESKSSSLSAQLKDKVEELFSVKESNKTLLLRTCTSPRCLSWRVN